MTNNWKITQRDVAILYLRHHAVLTNFAEPELRQRCVALWASSGINRMTSATKQEAHNLTALSSHLHGWRSIHRST